MTSLFATSDAVTLDQNWHHLDSTSARGKDLSNDAQMGAISTMEPELCMTMLINWTEKLRGKFPATTCGYSMAKIAHLDGAFLEVFERKASPVEDHSLQQKDKKRRKRIERQKRNLKSKF